MTQIDNFDVNSKLTNGVLWNNRRQCINKGLYFVFSHNDKLYNIIINEELIIIELRVKIKYEIEEKIVTINKKDNNYCYFKCMHDKDGSSYSTKYHGDKIKFSSEFELSIEEFNEDFSLILSNLESFEDIELMIDIALVRQYFFEYLNKNIYKK